MGKRIRFLSIALLPFALATPAAAAPPDHANNQKIFTVMTRNLYYGADLAPAIGAVASGDPLQIIAAVSEIFGKVGFTNFPARAEGLAREIAEAQPDLIGLQEASLWRSQTPADFVSGNAEHIEYDFVEILLQALAARGLHYAKITEETGLDAEFPGFLSEADAENFVLSDIRLTEHEVILARTDRKTSELKLSNPRSGHFAANFEFPISEEENFVLLRGWASVDVKVRGKSFRFVTTHLEDESEEVRQAQAIEVLLGPANTPLPVLVVGDFNSNANGDATTAAYSAFLGAGFGDAWLQAHPGDASSTCCNEELLTNAVPLVDDVGRIDLVLSRGSGDFGVLGAEQLGVDPATDRISNGVALIWPSDHAGLAAALQIRN